ncbi:uncharacterized protein LOC100648982 [Bombus terrestris]|uniref:Uncharacterized protein LOC100648982 n=1 Tax=Bombus terrestris TaxID=30195 RepID=A0A9C6SCS7_BOMTE|nr:uncharacterized protein LOC100648982 [Bombus terrestris]
MDAVLNEYEHLLTTPTSQTFKHQRSQSNSLSPRLYASSPCSNAAYAHYHSRKRQPSSHRRQCRNEQEQVLSIMKNTLHSGGNDHESFYCEYPRSMKNSYKKEGYCMKNGDQAMTGIMKTIDVDSETMEQYMRHKKERILKSESRTRERHHVDKVNRINADERYDLGGHKDDGWLYTKGKLRFNLSKHENENKIEEEGLAEDRNLQGNNRSSVQPNKLSILKGSSSQTSSKNKNVEDASKHKIPTVDANGYSKEADLSKGAEICKPCQRTVVQQNSPRSPGKESTSNSEESRDESSCCELVKEEDEESPSRKSIYAGGDLDLDLDLRATKSYIVDLIDRVLSKKFAISPGQQKNIESNRELTEQGFSIEIIRALRDDCCEIFAKDLSSHHETSAECIKRLKTLRSKHMQHIQDEFKKLCDLQKFLDEYSPRQSLPSFHSLSGAIEQRVEERQQQQAQQQQQHEEKQNLGTIS